MHGTTQHRGRRRVESAELNESIVMVLVVLVEPPVYIASSLHPLLKLTLTLQYRAAVIGKVIASTVIGMGALSTDSKKNKPDNADGMLEGGDDGGAGSWAASNGDNNGSDSVEAKDTLFVKELKGKAQVRGVECGDGGGGHAGARAALLVGFVYGVGRWQDGRIFSLLLFLRGARGASARPCCGSLARFFLTLTLRYHTTR